MSTVFLAQSFPLFGKWTNWATGVGSALLYLLAAYRFLSGTLYREQLLLTPDHFIIIQRRFIRKNIVKYQWRDMGALHYIGKDKKTDHPMKGHHYDYFGFDTLEHIVQSRHREGNLFFSYHGYPVRFGKNVYSWHAEELVNMMRLYAGDSFRVDPIWHLQMQEHEWQDDA